MIWLEQRWPTQCQLSLDCGKLLLQSSTAQRMCVNMCMPTPIPTLGMFSQQQDSCACPCLCIPSSQGVLEVARAAPGGVLVFFASYSMLDKLVMRWRVSALQQAVLCFSQPQFCDYSFSANNNSVARSMLVLMCKPTQTLFVSGHWLDA